MSSAGAALTVLAIGSAQAVLCVGAAPTPAARDREAQSVLRGKTGRPDITVCRRPSGRPRLEQPYPELGISLSHRGDLLLAAFSPTAEVGADLELDTPDLDAHRLARDHYSPAEANAIARLQADAARDAFLRLWVIKEAALKVTGRGIHDGVREPECAHLLDMLSHDGAVISLPPGPSLPALQLATRRLLLPARPTLYCAMAVAGRARRQARSETRLAI